MRDRHAPRTDQNGGACGPFAEVEWPGGLPWSPRFADRYHARQGGLAESRHVFLRHNGLPERWQAPGRAELFTVVEAGFGSGLNFLATWQLWRASAPAHRQLRYIALEAHPMRAADQRRALASAAAPSTLAATLLARMPAAPAPGMHAVTLPDNSTRLSLIIADIDRGLGMLAGAAVDAWFLDGFAPSRNPAMWSETLYRHMARISAPGARLATYTAAGSVRRALARHGFSVSMAKGFGAKRDMLCGHWAGRPNPSPGAPSSNLGPNPRPGAPSPNPRHADQASAIVVGAGLAGCHLAASLAARRCTVWLLERERAPMAGMRQLAIYTRLKATDTPQGRFALACLSHAIGHYGGMFEDGRLGGRDGARCGMLQLPGNERQVRAWRRVAERYAHYPELLQWADAERASALANAELQEGGLYFPLAGWLDPVALCRSLRADERIHFRAGCAVHRLERRAGAWHALDARGETLASAPKLALANSHAAEGLLPGEWAPALRASRGQLSYLLADTLDTTPRAVICRKGYILPRCETNGQRVVTIGSTYQRVDAAAAERGLAHADHACNWQTLRGILPSAAGWLAEPPPGAVVGGYAGLRCHTDDHLPVVGDCGLQGVYLNVGHGSRGVCQTPLCAELLAAQMQGEPLPMEAALVTALSPQRPAVRRAVRA